MIRLDEVSVYNNSQIFNLLLKRIQTTTNLEMLITGNTCSRVNINNQYLSSVIIKFECVKHVQAWKGRTEKLCIVRKLVEIKTGLPDMCETGCV